jgi:hypothetical protein
LRRLALLWHLVIDVLIIVVGAVVVVTRRCLRKTVKSAPTCASRNEQIVVPFERLYHRQQRRLVDYCA